MVHVFASTSDVQIEDSMHSTREEVVEKSIDSVKLVKDAGVECMFSPMDATRTELVFLGEVIEAVTDNKYEVSRTDTPCLSCNPLFDISLLSKWGIDKNLHFRGISAMVVPRI